MKIEFHRGGLVDKLSKVVFGLLIAVVLFSSCKIYKPAYFFKDVKNDTIISGFVNNDMELKIQKNDVLAISISSLNSTEDGLFNRTNAGGEGKGGFQVTPDGSIYLHKLGKLTVVGLTRKELKSKLENDLLIYLKDPIVTVNFTNHRVTVLGETTSQLIDMPEERIPLLEVMAKSGGAARNAQLNNLMIIRETQNAKQIKHLNLQDPSIFTSPWYYLQPNDIVVVKLNEAKVNDEEKRTRNLMIYTTLLSATTFILLITDRIFK